MKTYHIITIGCQMNKSDSERVASVLEKAGYIKTDDKEQADLVVLNTCGVRQSAEDRVYGLAPRIKSKNPGAKIVLTGCLVARADVRRRLDGAVDLWLPITDMASLQSQTLNLASLKFQTPSTKFQTNSKPQALKKFKTNFQLSDYLSIKPKYSSKYSAFVPIGNGCDNFCSYCVVPAARGREVWRPAGEILAEVRGLVKNGYKEIILIAQNVNSYKSLIPQPPRLALRAKRAFTRGVNLGRPPAKGESGGLNFADLLKMVNDIKGDFKIRFATSHPKDMSDKLIKAVKNCPKVLKEIHLPAQSGDNQVLKKMSRQYTIEHYKKIIKKIRRLMPEAKISTDIIVGFPGESKKQFEQTAKLMREVKFDMAYIAKYSPRPGTAAFKLADDVPPGEKKKRWQKLNSLLKY